MTDLYDEWWTQHRAIDEALSRGGEVLVTGLGLGLVIESILGPARSTVHRITVIEQSRDVIGLVAPYLHARYPGRVDVIEADAFAWCPPPGLHFTVGWHDIWPDPYAARCQPEMRALEARYAAICHWQGSWPREYLREIDGTLRPRGSDPPGWAPAADVHRVASQEEMK